MSSSSSVVGQDITVDLTENSQVPILRPRSSTRHADRASPSTSAQRRRSTSRNATLAPTVATRRARHMERSPAGEIRSPFQSPGPSGLSIGNDVAAVNPASASTTSARSTRPGARAAALSETSSATRRRRPVEALAPTPLVLPGNPASNTSTRTASSSAVAGPSRQRGITRDDSDIQITEVRQGQQAAQPAAAPAPAVVSDNLRLSHGLAPGPFSDPRRPMPVRNDLVDLLRRNAPISLHRPDNSPFSSRAAHPPQGVRAGLFGALRILGEVVTGSGQPGALFFRGGASGLGGRTSRPFVPPEGKYIRKHYKRKYTHGTEPLTAPFSDSVLAVPITLDEDDGTGTFKESAASDDVFLENGPICAGCDRALQMESLDEKKWVYALSCGHVIDGDCRDRLAGMGEYHAFGRPASAIPSARAEQKSRATEEKEKRRKEKGKEKGTEKGNKASGSATVTPTLEEVNVNMARINSNASSSAQEPPRKRTRLGVNAVAAAEDEDNTKKDRAKGKPFAQDDAMPSSDGGFKMLSTGNETNRCPVADCPGRWKHNSGSNISAVRLFV